MGSARRYTESEKKFIMENWHDVSQRKEICAQLDRSMGSCSFEYYNTLRRRGITPAAYRDDLFRRQVEQNKIKELNSAISPSAKLAMSESNIELITREFLALQLQNLASLIKEKEPTNLSALEEANQALKLQVQELEDLVKEYEIEVSNLKLKIDSSQKMFEEIDYWLSQYFSLSSIEKLTSLKDFLPRMKTVVDQYGTVVGTVREGQQILKASGD